MHFTTVTANPCVDRTIQVDSVNLGHSHRIQKTICDFSGKGINVSLALTQLGMPVKSVCLSHSDGEAADFFKQREMDAELRLNARAICRKAKYQCPPFGKDRTRGRHCFHRFVGRSSHFTEHHSGLFDSWRIGHSTGKGA